MPESLIAITANTSWYLYNFRKNLILELISNGHRVLAVAPQDEYSGRLAELGCEFQHIDIDQGGTNPAKDFITAVSFYRIFRKAGPTMVLNFTPKNNIYSTLAASRFKIPVINNIAGLGSVFIQEGAVASIARWLYRISQKHASHIFFQNHEDRNLFLEAGFVAPEMTSRLPGSGVDLSRFKPTPLPNTDSLRFLLVARLLYEKGVAEYAEAARLLKEKHPSTEFRIVGFMDSKNPSAVPRSKIEEWHESGVINYRGATDRIEEEISQVHCMVLPSYYREGVPRSLLEGGAMGRPIITTDNVGCRETVNPGITGFLCEPRSAKDLCIMMERIISMSTADLANMGVSSSAFIQGRFSESAVIGEYIERIKHIQTGSSSL